MLSARCFNLNRIVAVTLPHQVGINYIKKYEYTVKSELCLKIIAKSVPNHSLISKLQNKHIKSLSHTRTL
jgi:hypothetical protein